MPTHHSLAPSLYRHPVPRITCGHAIAVYLLPKWNGVIGVVFRVATFSPIRAYHYLLDTILAINRSCCQDTYAPACPIDLIRLCWRPRSCTVQTTVQPSRADRNSSACPDFGSSLDLVRCSLSQVATLSIFRMSFT